MALSPKQEMFCREYILDLNAAQAAIRAGYAEKTAKEQGARLLTNVNVQKFVQSLKSQREERLEIQADDVLKEILKLARSDVRQVFEPDGKLKNMDEWPDDVAACISSVEVNELFEFVDGDRVQVGWVKKVKFWDKVKCLELLAKHKALLTTNVNIGNTSDKPFQMQDVPLTLEDAAKLHQSLAKLVE